MRSSTSENETVILFLVKGRGGRTKATNANRKSTIKHSKGHQQQQSSEP